MLTSRTYDGGPGEERDRRAAESFERAGLSGSGYTRLDTGHLLGAGYAEGDDEHAPGWYMHVIHPASRYRNGDHAKVIETNLGTDHDHVGEAARRFFGRPDVLSAMADQVQPGEWHDPDASPWFRNHRWM